MPKYPEDPTPVSTWSEIISHVGFLSSLRRTDHDATCSVRGGTLRGDYGQASTGCGKDCFLCDLAAWVGSQKHASPFLKARSPFLGLLPPRPEGGNVLEPEHLCTLPSGAAGSWASSSVTSPDRGPCVPRAEGEPAFPLALALPAAPSSHVALLPESSSCSVLQKPTQAADAELRPREVRPRFTLGLRSKCHLFSFPGGEGRGDPVGIDLRHQELDTEILCNVTSIWTWSERRPLSVRGACTSTSDHAWCFGCVGRT